MAAVFLVALLLWLIVPPEWRIVTSKESPRGGWIAFELQSRSEAGDAPYGDHVVLAPAYWPFGHRYGETVFAGYCAGDLEFNWLTEYQLRLVCSTDEVVKQVDTYKEVRIQYEITHPSPPAIPAQ